MCNDEGGTVQWTNYTGSWCRTRRECRSPEYPSRTQFDMNFERIVTGVDAASKTISLDAALPIAFDRSYGDSFVYRATDGQRTPHSFEPRNDYRH